MDAASKRQAWVVLSAVFLANATNAMSQTLVFPFIPWMVRVSVWADVAGRNFNCRHEMKR